MSRRERAVRTPRRLYDWFDDRLDLRDGQAVLGKAFPAEDSFLLGEVALFCFLVLVLTGVFLGFSYEPSTTDVTYQGSVAQFQGQDLPEAFVSVLHITYDAPYGMFLRRLHHWAAHLFVASIDLPPGTGDVALTTLQEVPVDGVVFVTTPSPTAVADTRRSLALFRENDVPVLGVVANMGQFECPTCGDTHDLFPVGESDDPDSEGDSGGDADDEGAGGIDALDVPVLATLPFDPAVQETPAPGRVPEPFEGLAEQVRERLDAIWSVPKAERENAVDIRGVAPEERRERVRETVRSLEPGEEFLLVSDRDPTPVKGFLADLADENAAVEPFDIERRNPETWICRTVRP